MMEITMYMHSPASALVSTHPTATPRSEITTWNELINAFEAEPGLEALAQLARERQASGQELQDFGDDALACFEIARVNTGLEAVFDLSRADAWNMDQHGIERAIDELKAGATPEEAYATCKAHTDMAGRAADEDEPTLVGCQADALLPKLEALLAKEHAALEAAREARQAGHLREAERQELVAARISNDRFSLEEAASKAQATSQSGALMQLAFAMHHAELIRGSTDQAVRDQYHTTFEELMMSALRVLSDHIPPAIWESYVGGDHPGTYQPLAAEHTAAAWQAARQAFLAAQARHEAMDDVNTVEDEEAFTAKLAAEMTYAQTPPPNVEALATMLRDVLNFDGFPDADDRADKRESIQKLLNDDEPGMNYLGMAYQHATRLAGEVGEIHEARRGMPTQHGLTGDEFNAHAVAQSAAA